MYCLRLCILGISVFMPSLVRVTIQLDPMLSQVQYGKGGRLLKNDQAGPLVRLYGDLLRYRHRAGTVIEVPSMFLYYYSTGPLRL